MKSKMALKMTGVLLIPVAAFVISCVLFDKYYTNRQLALIHSEKNLSYFKTVSELIHETAIERSIVINRMMGIAVSGELEHQQEKVNTLVQQSESFNLSQNTPSHRENDWYKIIDALHSARMLLKSNATPQEVWTSYNSVNDELLEIETIATETDVSPLDRNPLYFIHLLEFSKESASRLASSMVWILKLQKPIDELVLLDLMENRGAYQSTQRMLSQSALEQLNPAAHSAELSAARALLEGSFRNIFRNHLNGQYHYEPKTVLSSSSTLIQQMHSLIEEKITELYSEYYKKLKDTSNSLLWIRISIAASLVALVLLIWLSIRAISGSLYPVLQLLRSGITEIESTAQELQSSGHQLLQKTSVSSASIRGLAASLENLARLLRTNSGSYTQCTEATANCRAITTRGKQALREFIQCFQDIGTTHTQFIQQFDDNYERLLQITSNIREIGAKTQFMHEIVFQAKLLSFNAAVEAARVGENGKSFSVVAEEFGNLAQMSGQTSTLISEMLNGSVREIDQMIQQTRSKVERIVSNAQEKGRTGTLTSEQFTAAWDEMAKHMGSVHETVKQLTQISSEQTREIHDLKQGLAEVDQMTHQQSVSAEKLTGTFQEFLTRVQRIRSFVRNLILMIGASDERSTPSHSDHEPS